MMKDYIERGAVLELLRKWADGYSYIEIEAALAIRGITAIPAADVRPVVRGEWVSVFDIGTVCNRCGYDIEAHGFDVRTDGEPNFCPNCGADMRGDDNG